MPWKVYQKKKKNCHSESTHNIRVARSWFLILTEELYDLKISQTIKHNIHLIFDYALALIKLTCLVNVSKSLLFNCSSTLKIVCQTLCYTIIVAVILNSLGNWNTCHPMRNLCTSSTFSYLRWCLLKSNYMW